MKKIFNAIKELKRKHYEFAIQKVTQGEKIKLLPVAKEPGSFSWRPIVKVYDYYMLMDHEKENGLTQDECLQHIYKFQEQLEAERKSKEYSKVYTKVTLS